MCPAFLSPAFRRANQSRKSGRRRKLWATASNCLLLWARHVPPPTQSQFSAAFLGHRWLLFHCSLSAVSSFVVDSKVFLSVPRLLLPTWRSLPFSSSMAERFGGGNISSAIKPAFKRLSGISDGASIGSPSFLAKLKCDLSVFSPSISASLKFAPGFASKVVSSRHLSLGSGSCFIVYDRRVVSFLLLYLIGISPWIHTHISDMKEDACCHKWDYDADCCQLPVGFAISAVSLPSPPPFRSSIKRFTNWFMCLTCCQLSVSHN